ncbi:MAG: SLBB domain-containing protein [Candidatus Acidiferrales bacterium]
MALKSVRKLFCVLGAASLVCAGSRAQSPQGSAAPAREASASELGRENLNRVAASAIDIKAVLVKDAGLMVELKRWIAKDATDHGQVVSDADLTDDAIFERLELDVSFRSTATELLQHYGYLLPKFNPGSEPAQEREALFEQRAKWLAENQQANRPLPESFEVTGWCDPQFDPGSDCNAQPIFQAPSEAREQQQQQQPSQQQQQPQQEPGGPPSRPAPSGPGAPAAPYGGTNSLERTQLMQTEGGPAMAPSTSQISQTSASYISAPSFNGLGESASGTSPTGNGSLDAQFGDLLPEENSGSSGADNVFPAYGVGTESRRTSASPAPQMALFQPARMVREPSPYDDIPSIYDMYMQAVPRPAVPRRFGAEIFENGSRDPQLIPMDLPAGPDYVVGPGDGLAINLWGGVSERFYRTVDREGRVSLPEVGPILVSGKSLADVQENLQQILRTQFRDVSADVSLGRLRTIRVYVVGDVANPGAYDISSLSTPLNALFAAGGPTTGGSLRILKHCRGNQLVEQVDVYDLLLHGVKGDMERLENGDTVLAPPIGPQVIVEGMVRRPAIYELKDEKNLSDVLELAGGLLPAATLRHIEVERIMAHEKRTMLSVDVPEEQDEAEAAKTLDTFEIQDGDRIRVYPIAPYNQDAVYLEGHVLRPGRYSYRAGMRVTDVISSYQDLLPEPAAQYAEIIRLNAPDFRPSVEGFDLGDALSNPAQAPVLEPLDTVRVFSRYDFENPPTISVGGSVRNPGTYRTSGEIRLRDAIAMAGGLDPEAATENTQVFRYLQDGQLEIFSVSLSGALAGDPAENILLESRDRLLVHRNPEAVEPATVYVKGEVAKPGRYPLTANMRVADLILVGGGLQPGADTQTADLTHFEWQNEKQLTGQSEEIAISGVLAEDPKANVALHNGDVLTIRQLPGWNDLGAFISVNGEVEHAGSYGIRPGERLSSILERAGGFQPDAYPYGAVLERPQVRDLEMRARTELILRVRDAQTNLETLPEADPKQKQAKEMAVEQWQTTLDQLVSTPPAGRVTIRISSDIKRWKNTADDIEVRAGDTLVIPKRPSFVMVTGQVMNPTAISCRPGKSAKWYLSQAGGPTQLADKKGIFVIRADGSVLGSGKGMWSGDSMGRTLEPGDAVVVPERVLGGGLQWQNLFAAAQVASSVTSSLFVALKY